MERNPLTQLGELGQSVWCDNIRRGLIHTELARMIEDGEITGLTSNPTIFEKAIDGSTDYDDDLKKLAEAGKSATEIYESLAVDDIRAVADLLRPIYDRTTRHDGYASFEVSPKLAQDTAASLAEAKRLFAWIDRENVMIKIPGTPEGVPAIEQAIADGVNINVTLLFSIDNYEEVARAYIRALERLGRRREQLLPHAEGSPGNATWLQGFAAALWAGQARRLRSQHCRSLCLSS